MRQWTKAVVHGAHGVAIQMCTPGECLHARQWTLQSTAVHCDCSHCAGRWMRIAVSSCACVNHPAFGIGQDTASWQVVEQRKGLGDNPHVTDRAMRTQRR